VTLSTVHSAKGLEWDAVLVIDLVEERFPSRHAMNDSDDFEEERRLLYVACTRARDSLTLFSPESLYSRELSATTPARVCPFLQDIPGHLLSRYREQFTGGVGLQTLPTPRRAPEGASPMTARPGPGEDFETEPPRSASSAQTPVQGTYCRHKIFGRGKVSSAWNPTSTRSTSPASG
jgi:DNA helicase II / ATP-dependent DNA helicase PcrA